MGAAFVRTVRTARAAVEMVGEFVGEAVLEVVATVVACLVLVAVIAGLVWGWGRSPLLTGGVGGVALAFLGYGAWEAFRPADRSRGRPGRLAAAAAVSFGAAALVVLYGSECACG